MNTYLFILIFTQTLDNRIQNLFTAETVRLSQSRDITRDAP
jgi:hypothetical protein